MNEGETLNKKRFKLMTTPTETIPIRGIHEQFRKYHARCKVICFTNYMPVFPGETLHADRRRLRVYPMKMTYVHNPDPNNPFEAQINASLEHGIGSYADAFLGELFSLYAHYMNQEGTGQGTRELPGPMVKAAEEAFSNMDPLLNFITSTYENTGNRDIHVTTEEVSTEVRLFEKNNDMASKFPSGPNKLLHKLDMIFNRKVMTSEERKINVGGTTVRGWRGWRKLEE